MLRRTTPRAAILRVWTGGGLERIDLLAVKMENESKDQGRKDEGVIIQVESPRFHPGLKWRDETRLFRAHGPV